MNKLSINLLPIEFREQDLKAAKFYKIQIIGVAVILLMVFLSSSTVALRILQSQNISRIQKELTLSEQKVAGLKNTEGLLSLLKNRLTTINQILGSFSKQTQMYNLVTKLLPPSVAVSSISVGKNGEALILVTAPNGDSLDELIGNLTSRETNEDKVSQVSLENVNRGRDGIYRSSLKVKPK